MKTKKYLLSFVAACMVLLLGACNDWGQMDAPAGNQVTPTLEQVSHLSFDEELTPEEFQKFAYPAGDTPAVVEEEVRGSVLHLENGYGRIANPLPRVQNGVSLTMWVKQMPLLTVGGDEENPTVTQSQDLTGALFSFQNENHANRIFFTANGWLSYEGADGSYEDNNPSTTKTGLLTLDQWHYVAISVHNEGYFVYVDGEKRIDKYEPTFDFSKIVQFMASVPHLYLGYGSGEQTGEWFIDDLKIYRNKITAKEWSVPGSGGSGGGEDGDEGRSGNEVYFNNFEKANDGTSIYGGGSFVNVGGKFGRVFQNATGAPRSHYLLLPENVLSHSANSKAMSIGVWVNAANAGDPSSYMWSPLFSAYASGPEEANGTPMFICQYRGIIQVSNNGWCDFTDAQNVAGSNGVYHNETDWLADKQWHYYTVTLTETTAQVYFDGVLVNEWATDGTSEGHIISGLFANGADLKYICLGGNQAWNWGDPDPAFMFDDFAVYDRVLTAADIKNIMDYKHLPATTYYNDFEEGLKDAVPYGTGKLEDFGRNWGQVFQNVGGGMRANYLLLPSDALSHTADSKALTLSFWVNAKNAGESSDYAWAPLFTAYGSGPATENSWPMFACQYRGLLQVNCAGWCNFEDAQHATGGATLYHNDLDWLADKGWHLYTAVLTETNAKVYLDGVIANEWNLDPTAEGQNITGLFSDGAELKYVCLGGNQAWSWGDPDPGFAFDYVAIYNVALSQEQIKTMVNRKK